MTKSQIIRQTMSLLTIAAFVFVPFTGTQIQHVSAAESLPSNVTLQQWADVGGSWQNGNLNNSNSNYSEGEVVPYRLGLSSNQIVIGEQYDFSVCRDYENGSVRGFLNLDEFDTDRAAAAGGTVTSTNGPFSGVNVTIDSVTEVGGQGACSSGARETQVTITVDDENPFVLWGGYLASPSDSGVGAGNGASQFPGGSLHMKLLSPNKDRSIQTSAIIPEEPTTEDTAELCSDGIDNDEDGDIDLADEDCSEFRPTLTVIKSVDGGNASASDFDIDVTGPDGFATTTEGVEDPGVTFTFTATGTVSVVEQATSTYDVAYTGNCDGEIGFDTDWTCTVENTLVEEGTTTPTTADISGMKWNDENGDTDNANESGLSGWLITLYSGTSTTVVATTTTDGNGDYSFTGIDEGDYTVCEEDRSGWSQTFPTSGETCLNGTTGHFFSLAGGQDVDGQDFGNMEDEVVQQCVEGELMARIVINDFSNEGDGNVTDDMYVGGTSTIFASGEWFPLTNNQSFINDSDVSGYQDVEGLAVERSNGQVRVVLHGSQTSSDNESVFGFVEFTGTTPLDMTEDPANPLENENDGITAFPSDEIDQAADNELDDGTADFVMHVNVADDGFIVTYDTEIEFCPDEPEDEPEDDDDSSTSGGGGGVINRNGDDDDDDGEVAGENVVIEIEQGEPEADEPVVLGETVFLPSTGAGGGASSSTSSALPLAIVAMIGALAVVRMRISAVRSN